MAESLYTTETPASETNESPGPTLGTVIILAVAGQVTHLKWYCPSNPPNNAASLPFILYDAVTQTQLARTTASVSPGWNTVALPTPVSTTAGQRVLPSVYTDSRYAYTGGYFNTSGLTVGNLTAPATGSDPIGNGRFHTGSEAYPEATFGGNNYWTDIVFVAASTPVVAPAGIAVPVNLGSPTVTQNLAVAPAGIAVPTAVGAPSVSMAAGTVNAAGIAVPAAVGAPSVSGPLYNALQAGSWWGLESTLDASRSLIDFWNRRQPVACPNDGEPLRRSPDGILYCPYDNWRPDGQNIRRRVVSQDWGRLRGIKQAAIADAAVNQLLLACPNDGEPLSVGAHGERFCKFDGWMPPE